MFDASLLNLPWATLVTLVCGYIGYFIANVGLNEHHRPIDVTFSTLVFGLLASLFYSLTLHLDVGHFQQYLATFSALAFGAGSGAFWRKYARKWMYKFLRHHDISWSDNTSSAWQAMFGHTEFRVTEIYVFLKDGSGLLCRLPGKYEAWPNGPFTLGNKGDITLYVTHRKSTKGKDWVEYEGLVDSSWGAMATYVPVEQIARVDIRRKKVDKKA
ncbi:MULTISPECIES: hypothetical protein [unclassified Serratia (in: enterobacteria)]|uniref:hypothetical protein n=1 Tax=unclassified Serratia (in: enterobacteria) TaxID=2647522 RepID=UPI00050349E1|nr:MULTISPECIES: hypothetical protein [unclassified Serratia (in: enterobacteria)]KFK92761.1 membrane protein [Serratia sp. Ag2]KFK96532.1 membrane protein [Serratia sp. Ag1]